MEHGFEGLCVSLPGKMRRWRVGSLEKSFEVDGTKIRSRPISLPERRFFAKVPYKNMYITIKRMKIQNPKTKRPPDTLIDLGIRGFVPIVGTENPSVYWGFRGCVGNRVGNCDRRDAIQ